VFIVSGNNGRTTYQVFCFIIWEHNLNSVKCKIYVRVTRIYYSSLFGIWTGAHYLAYVPHTRTGIEVETMPVWYHWGDTGQTTENAWHTDWKGLPGSVPEMEMVGQVSTCRRELLWEWRWPIVLMATFTIFTASVSTILDTNL